MSVKNSDRLPDVPWEAVLEEVNEYYQEIIEKQFGDNEELLQILEDTGVIAIEYQSDPGPSAEQALATGFWEEMSVAITDELRRVLIEEYEVPEEIAKHIYPSQFGTQLLYYGSWAAGCWRRVDCTRSNPAGNKYVECPC